MERFNSDNAFISYLDIVKQFNINRGDILLVSSDITKLLIQEYKKTRVKPDLNLFIDTLIKAVGEEGTLLFPTFNWDWCSGKTYDYYKTPCKTGILGEIALSRSDFKRTKHPIYSFAVYGKDQEMLCRLDNVSSWGEDSVFAYLDYNKAKNLLIGISFLNCYTFLHYVEQYVGVPYRYNKNFRAKYIDEQGDVTSRVYSMYVRRLEWETEGLFDIDKDFITQGAAIEKTINGIMYYIVDMHATRDIIADDILNNNCRKIAKYYEK